MHQASSSGRAPGWPISFEDVLAARRRIEEHIRPTPLRRYEALDAWIGEGISVWIKHENHNPTNSFKARNGLSAVSAIPAEDRARGVVAASRGNYGLGLAWAGSLLSVPVAVCVPLRNNPEKNEAIRGLGAELIEEGRDYDDSVEVAGRLARERGMRIVHSTNEPAVIAGAATLTLEILEELPDADALVVSVGGGSQAVGAMTVAREMKPGLAVFGVQAERAPAAYESWRSGRWIATESADTFADGLATRNAYELTLPALREGLAGFVTVSEAEIAEALRQILRTTHNLAEGAGAAAVAGLAKLRETLRGRKVAAVLSGGNIDSPTLLRVLSGGI